MRILFALPGLHRYERGAEVALNSIAAELARSGDDITLIGAGHPRSGDPYRFLHAGVIGREAFERFPSIPILRSETAYEEASFAFNLLRQFKPQQFDVTVTCSYPFTNWVLRRKSGTGMPPAHVFVTQNGDWPAQSDASEYRYFGCDGLACTNPDYFERNRNRWHCALIPNGIDVARFSPGPAARERFGLPLDKPVILMVSAFIPTKRVADGIKAVSRLPDAHLVVAGDGPLRNEIDALAAERLPGRFTRLTVKGPDMPDLYRSADIFLHMSIEESFGNVYVEAMACDRPIVGHGSSRLRWIVGEAEFLADTTDSDALLASLRAALAASSNPSPARVERARTFSWTSIARQYRSFFEEIVEGRTRNPDVKR
jgi:glycosyltransferase involved in cell wall biosynthesis